MCSPSPGPFRPATEIALRQLRGRPFILPGQRHRLVAGRARRRPAFAAGVSAQADAPGAHRWGVLVEQCLPRLVGGDQGEEERDGAPLASREGRTSSVQPQQRDQRVELAPARRVVDRVRQEGRQIERPSGEVEPDVDLRTLGHSRKGKPPRDGLKRRRREEEKLRATRERNRKPRGLKDKSIRNIQTTLSTILSSAVEWGYLAAMPRLPKVKVDDPQ